jgi:hypothetical protein
MITVHWFRYPHGIEGEAMKGDFKSFENSEKAIDFLHKKVKRIKGINWAGGYVEDEELELLYEITSDCEVCDHRSVKEENKATD